MKLGKKSRGGGGKGRRLAKKLQPATQEVAGASWCGVGQVEGVPGWGGGCQVFFRGGSSRGESQTSFSKKKGGLGRRFTYFEFGSLPAEWGEALRRNRRPPGRVWAGFGGGKIITMCAKGKDDGFENRGGT